MFGLNPWVLLAILAVVVGGVGYKAFQMGQDSIQVKWDADKAARALAQAEAENNAANEIDKTKKESQIVYRYIKEQDNNCDIYDAVIERLSDPAGNQ